MPTIKNLHVAVEGTPVLNGVDLAIHSGEMVVLMGPNGCGKSTLAHVLAGREGYEVTEGSIDYDGNDLLAMSIDERARAGVFLSFQTPVEIPGVSVVDLLVATGVNREIVEAAAKKLKIDETFLKRDLGVGASGGEKKMMELLQMAVLEPRLCIIDEIDSGLDVDALKRVADGINQLRSPDRAFLIITHYQRLLDHLTPDRVVVMQNGRIVKDGGVEVAKGIDQHGYDCDSCES